LPHLVVPGPTEPLSDLALKLDSTTSSMEKEVYSVVTCLNSKLIKPLNFASVKTQNIGRPKKHEMSFLPGCAVFRCVTTPFGVFQVFEVFTNFNRQNSISFDPQKCQLPSLQSGLNLSSSKQSKSVRLDLAKKCSGSCAGAYGRLAVTLMPKGAMATL